MKHWLPILCSSLGALLLITAGGWTLGYQPLWAFSFLIYVPLPLRLLLGALPILAALLVPTLGVGMKHPGGSRRSASSLPNHQTFFYLIPAGLLFWFGREQTYHGDALLKLQLLSTQTLRTDPYIWKEPLDSFSAYTLTAFVGSPATAVALLSVLAGVVYVAAVIGLTRFVAVTRFQQISYAVALLALGSSQLWFGHIENYSLVTAATFLTIVLAIGYLKERVKLLWVGLVAGMAVSFHPQALFAMPALLILCVSSGTHRKGMNYHTPTMRKSFLVLGSSALVAPLLTIALLLLAGAPLPHIGNGYAGDPQLFWRIDQALAPNRLLDALNNLWLIAPLAPLWLVIGGWGFTQVKLRQDPIFRYLSLVTLGLLFYHFSFQNDLPRWRDWDLFAITGPALSLWGIYSWWAGQSALHGAETSWPFPDSLARCNALCLLALVFAAIFTTAWVGVNHYRLLLRPNPDQRAIYRQYQLLDLRAMLPSATITPDTPICAEATGCERVSATAFTMPQDGDERPTIFAHAPAQIAWPLPVPSEPTFLWLSPALDPVAWGWGGDGVTFAVVVRHDGAEETLWSRHLTPAEPRDLDWQEVFVDLTPYAGQSVTLVLVTSPGIADNNAGDRAGWGLPWLMRGTVDRRFGP
ncbi:MAG: hypothetical protein DYG89_37205 [Caldilinea sp. CFX5]|nr:hypothetical protein [Caldilinea sp. CFX5]